MELRGCGTALVTPFTQDGAVDETALRNLVSWQVESGIDFLIPCGTTGETPTLTHDEWLHVIDVTIEVAAGRVPVVAGATSNSTQEAIAKAKEVAARPRVNAILTASPYYNKPTQEGQYRHFKAIAEAVGDKPIILYNVPGRTGANLEPATLARLAEIPNIVGVKEASGDMDQMGLVCAGKPAHFNVWSGDDSWTLPLLAVGGYGVICVVSHIAGASMKRLIDAYGKADIATARDIHQGLLPVIKTLMTIAANPVPIKSALNAMGFPAGPFRLPLVPLTDDQLKTVMQTIGEAGNLITFNTGVKVA